MPRESFTGVAAADGAYRSRMGSSVGGELGPGIMSNMCTRVRGSRGCTREGEVLVVLTGINGVRRQLGRSPASNLRSLAAIWERFLGQKREGSEGILWAWVEGAVASDGEWGRARARVDVAATVAARRAGRRRWRRGAHTGWAATGPIGPVAVYYLFFLFLFFSFLFLLNLN